jgi:hypothetical protein
MARSFRYEHFTVPTSGADRDRSRRDKQEVAAQREQTGGGGEVHYGKQFAETEATHQSRAETRAKGHSPSPAASATAPRRPGAESRRKSDPSKGGVAAPSAAEERPPLGATAAEELPAAEGNPAETPLEQLVAFRDHAIRSFVGLVRAARQFGTAGREMAGLPIQGLRLLIRIGRAWLGEAPRRGRTV